MRSLRVPALVVGVTLVACAAALGVVGSRTTAAAADRRDEELAVRSQYVSTLLAQTFERARTTELVLANDQAFRSFADAPGDREPRSATGPGVVAPVVDSLRYVATLFPGAVDSTGFVDPKATRTPAWSRDARCSSVTSTTCEGAPGSAGPSPRPRRGLPDRAVPVARHRRVGRHVRLAGLRRIDKLGVVHIELTMDSLRTEIVNNAGTATVRVLDPETGAVILDSRFTQAAKPSWASRRPHVHRDHGGHGPLGASGCRQPTASPTPARE